MSNATLSLDFDGLRPPCAALDSAREAWRASVRKFVDEAIAPNLAQWSEHGTFPDALYQQAAAAGILGLGYSADGDLATAGLYDRIIVAEEMHRPGSGLAYADLATSFIALAPVAAQGAAALKTAVVQPVLRGERKISFAVTEPSGGSDLSQLCSTAEQTADGWLLSGEKTLISGVMRADEVLTAVRTESDGKQGLSLFLVDTSTPGVTREPVHALRWYNANVGTIRFDNVLVPHDRLIGQPQRGFASLVAQFNTERFCSIAAALALARVAVADAIAFARQRQVFGQRRIDHQAIRHKLVDQVRALRCAYVYLDHCATRFERGEPVVADLALLKVQATTTLEQCAREALHVVGGSAYGNEDGPGHPAAAGKLERILRESRIFALAGGTEEVLRDLAARQMKF